tara:strand:+ start:368 stop:541 length:174 start_codon:yes stop_codon:yes gene_type:complete
MHGLVTAGRGVVVALAVMRHDRLHLLCQQQRGVQMLVLDKGRLVQLPHLVELTIGRL